MILVRSTRLTKEVFSGSGSAGVSGTAVGTDVMVTLFEIDAPYFAQKVYVPTSVVVNLKSEVL